MKWKSVLITMIAGSLVIIFLRMKFPPLDSQEQKSEISTPEIAKEVAPKPDSTPIVPIPKEKKSIKSPRNYDSKSYINHISNKGNLLPPLHKKISLAELSGVLESISENLEEKKLAYSRAQGQDCSGIFHQIKDSIQERIPELSQTSKFQYPIFKKDRSSRQIAHWYHKHGNLQIIRDPIKSKNTIRPGTVLFFSRPNQDLEDLTIERLTGIGNKDMIQGIITHVAIVTTVKLDEKGNVIEYTMMHGRNNKYPASRTTSKELPSKYNKHLPPFGNWNQDWVAVANIATAK